MDPIEFESVLRAARDRGEWAWSRLYRWVAPDVLGYLRARNAPSAEDLVGEVMVQLARNLSGFEGGPREFRSWVFMIAHHRMIDAFRKKSSDPSFPEAPEDLPHGRAVGDVADTVVAALTADELREVLSAHLTDDQLTVFLLKVFGGFDANEIAQITGRNSSTVRVIHHRATKVLRDVFGHVGVTK